MYTFEEWKKNLIIVRGGGDIATGTIYKLYQSRVLVFLSLIWNKSWNGGNSIFFFGVFV